MEDKVVPDYMRGRPLRLEWMVSVPDPWPLALLTTTGTESPLSQVAWKVVAPLLPVGSADAPATITRPAMNAAATAVAFRTSSPLKLTPSTALHLAAARGGDTGPSRPQTDQAFERDQRSVPVETTSPHSPKAAMRGCPVSVDVLF